jgi:hypothetical protein
LYSHSTVSQHFIEPEGSLSHSHELSNCSYPESDKSSPYHPILSLQDPASIPGPTSDVHIPLLRSYIQKIRPGPRLFRIFRNKLAFHGEGLLSPRPTTNLQDHLLSFVRECLFSMLAATLHCWLPSLYPQHEDAPTVEYFTIIAYNFLLWN